MSWLTQALRGVTHAVSQIGDVVGPAFGTIIKNLPTVGGAALIAGSTGGAGLIGEIGSWLGDAGSTIGGWGTAIYDGVKSLFSGGFGDALSNVADIAGKVGKLVDSVAADIGGVLKPIGDTVDAITQTVNKINDELVAPIANTLKAFQTQYTTLVTALHTDLNNGLQGILQIPQDISNALTGVDAQFQRMTQEMTAGQRSTATDVIAPAMHTAGASWGQSVGDAFHPSQPSTQTQGIFSTLDRLKDESTAVHILGGEGMLPPGTTLPHGEKNPTISEFVTDWTSYLTQSQAWWAEPLRAIWGLLFAATVMGEEIKNEIAVAGQQANQNFPVELLAPGNVIEAWRRGLLTDEDAKRELHRQGIDDSRIKVLYDVAQFLFGPREAYELYARDIISQDDFFGLMSQNNLSQGQTAALEELMTFYFGMSEANAARARGIFDDATFQRAAKYNRFRLDDAEIAYQLSFSPTAPGAVVRSLGRASAAAKGIMRQTLEGATPDAVKSAYQHAQLHPEQADRDWLLHWYIPQAAWWCDAYFRGLRTRTEVHQAFEALNIPSELWEDVIATEEELPPVWLVPDVVASGVWGREEAVTTLKKLGFSEENATVLYNYGASKSKTTKADTAAELAKLSLGNARALFDDGIIDSQGYTQILLDHGYSQEAANLTAELATFEQATKERQDFAQLLIAQVRLGTTTKADAESQLFDAGFTSSEVAKFLTQIENASVIHGKLPSESQLDKLLTSGAIDTAKWLETMQLLGYSEFWANALLTLVSTSG